MTLTTGAATPRVAVGALPPESRAETTGRMDWLGVLCLVISVGAALIAINEAGKLDDANWALVIGLFVVAAVMFFAFWRVEDRGSNPLVETRHLRQRSTGVLVLALIAAGLNRILLLVLSIAIGITYAGTVNIMLNGLGIVLSPNENPGFLPGLNAGAFNLGAGLSFAVLYAVSAAFTPAESTSAAGYVAGMLAGVVILAAALAASFLIPRPRDDEAAAARRGGSGG
jgi:hypothetical protein